MPYITQKERANIDPYIIMLLNKIQTKGALNYVITKLVHKYVLNLVKTYGKSYFTLSEGYNVLSEAAQEYYRSILGKYEDEKRIENGTVSELDSID